MMMKLTRDQMSTIVEKTFDQNMSPNLSKDFLELTEKYNRLKTQTIKFHNILEKIKQKAFDFVDGCLCGHSKKRFNEKIQLMEEIRDIQLNIDYETIDITGISSFPLIVNPFSLDTTETVTNVETKPLPQELVTIDDNDIEVIESSVKVKRSAKTKNFVQNLKKSETVRTLPLITIPSQNQSIAIPSTVVLPQSLFIVTNNSVIPLISMPSNLSSTQLPLITVPLDNNSTEVDKTRNKFECLDCNQLFETRDKKRYHQKNNCPNRTYKEKKIIECHHLYCKKQFVSEESFKRHMNRHLGIIDDNSIEGQAVSPSKSKKRVTVKKWKCEWKGCQKMFVSKTVRLRHTNAFHLNIKDIECMFPGCRQKFVSKTDMESHMGSEHSMKLYKCQGTGCEQQFSTRKNLARHYKDIHLNIKRFKCDQCDQYFVNTEMLFRHKTIKHNVRKRYVCEWPDCQQAMNERKQFVEHQRTHTGEKPVLCPWPECGRGFAHESTLKKHILMHKGIKPYKCEVCGKTFANRTNFKIHRKNKHKLKD